MEYKTTVDTDKMISGKWYRAKIAVYDCFSGIVKIKKQSDGAYKVKAISCSACYHCQKHPRKGERFTLEPRLIAELKIEGGMGLKKPNKSFSAADTEKALEILKDMYIEGRETGHPLYSDEWKLVEEELVGLNYDRKKVKIRFEELCNI